MGLYQLLTAPCLMLYPQSLGDTWVYVGALQVHQGQPSERYRHTVGTATLTTVTQPGQMTQSSPSSTFGASKMKAL